MKRRNIMVLMISLSLILLLGSSYALLKSTQVGSTPYVINVGTLQVTFDSGQTEKLSLENMYPMSDKEGSSQINELGFTVKNTGTVASYYDITLEETSTTPKFKSVIRFISNKDSLGYNEPKTLSEDKYIDVGGYLETNRSSSYKVKIWLDYNADNTYMSQEFKAKVVINSFQESEYAKDVIKSKLVKYSESSKDNFQGGLIAVNTEGGLYNETDDSQKVREYRYNGLKVNNYVKFDNEIWRIIGVFKENHDEFIKIVRQDSLPSNYFPENFYFDDTLYKIHSMNENYPFAAYYNYITASYSETVNWAKAGIQYYLNNEVDNSETPNYGYLHYLSDSAKNMIRLTKYYLGSFNEWYENERWNTRTTVDVYNLERDVNNCIDNTATINFQKGCYIWSGFIGIWKGKIGLMYPSDIGYAVNSKYWDNREILQLNENQSWYTTLYEEGNVKQEWLISPSTNMYYNPTNMLSRVNVDGIGYMWADYMIVRPTLYLKSNVKITSGDGTEQQPYLLEI